ncbi:MAG: hypothetical protein AMJ90_08025 [candidate division Zixibacteria bacterium SM23_73_2]|nr:MAG: hypothetical protein AMJ90_08025 [candidate division Zixibacteria bacterium SM23_73_2]
MTFSHTKELRQLILLGFFLAIAPLVFFPKDLGIKMALSPIFAFAIELVWYFLILSLLFPSLPFSWVAGYGFLVLVLRLTLGLLFGLFLVIMFPLELKKAFGFGVFNYFPAFAFQVFLLPFMVKHSLGEMLIKLWIEKKQKPGFSEKTEEVSYLPKRKVKAQDIVEEVPVRKEKEVSLEVSMEDAINYLREYPGVEGVLLVDSDGLVVVKNLKSGGQDEDKLAPFGVNFKKVNTQLLKKLNEEKIEKIQILSDKLWINLTTIGNFCLLTLADRHTDELLNIRISKASESIKKYLEQRYGQKILSSEEEEYVSNLRGA